MLKYSMDYKIIAKTGEPFFLLLPDGNSYFLPLDYPNTEGIYAGICYDYERFLIEDARSKNDQQV